MNELAQTLASLVSEEEEEEEEQSENSSGVDETELAILGGIARIVIDLCSRRLRKQYRSEMTGMELLDLAEVRLLSLSLSLHIFVEISD